MPSAGALMALEFSAVCQGCFVFGLLLLTHLFLWTSDAVATDATTADATTADHLLLIIFCRVALPSFNSCIWAIITCTIMMFSSDLLFYCRPLVLEVAASWAGAPFLV